MPVETSQNGKSPVVVSMRDSFTTTQLTFDPADNWMKASILLREARGEALIMASLDVSGDIPLWQIARFGPVVI